MLGVARYQVVGACRSRTLQNVIIVRVWRDRDAFSGSEDDAAVPERRQELLEQLTRILAQRLVPPDSKEEADE